MIQNTIDSFNSWLIDLGTRLRVEREGATAVEYGLFVALIAGVIIGTVVLIGTRTNTAMDSVCDQLTAASDCN